MTNIQTRATLDGIGCGNPRCQHDRPDHGELYLRQVCHPGGGLDVSYVHADGTLKIACKRCGVAVAMIAVAP